MAPLIEDGSIGYVQPPYEATAPSLQTSDVVSATPCMSREAARTFMEAVDRIGSGAVEWLVSTGFPRFAA